MPAVPRCVVGSVAERGRDVFLIPPLTEIRSTHTAHSPESPHYTPHSESTQLKDLHMQPLDSSQGLADYSLFKNHCQVFTVNHGLRKRDGRGVTSKVNTGAYVDLVLYICHSVSGGGNWSKMQNKRKEQWAIDVFACFFSVEDQNVRSQV